MSNIDADYHPEINYSASKQNTPNAIVKLFFYQVLIQTFISCLANCGVNRPYAAMVPLIPHDGVGKFVPARVVAVSCVFPPVKISGVPLYIAA